MLRIVVAHLAEGEPFIQAYGLKRRDQPDGNQHYTGAGVSLLVAGQGRQRIERSLTRELANEPASDSDVWLNFGVAGAGSLESGSIVGIRQIFRGLRTESDVITLTPLPGLNSVCCCSVEQPATDYPDRGVVDMEAYYLARLLESNGLIQQFRAIKLVADTPASPLAALGRCDLSKMLGRAANALTAISDKLIST